MLKVKVTVVHNRFPQLRASMAGAVGRHTRRVAYFVRDDARRRAPVRTGALRASIEVDRLGLNHYAVIVGVPYGVYVEFGTSRMAAQPFLYPAIRSAQRMLGEIRYNLFPARRAA